MTPELQALTQRVEDLERQVAHLEALAVEHSDTDRTEAARTINAQKFVVTDARGVRRAELSAVIPQGGTEENPWLGLFDAEGNVRACLGVGEGLPWLEFYDANQSSPLQIRIDEHGPHIALYYRNREPAVVIKLLEDGPRMSLIAANGKESVVLAVSGEGPPMMLTDAKGQLSLEVASSGAKELFMIERSSEAQPQLGRA